MKISGKSWIGYENSSYSKLPFHVILPESQKKSDYIFHEVSTQEIDNAVEKAEKAFKTYRNIDSSLKADFLKNIALSLNQYRELLIQTFCEESALPRERANQELDRTIYQLNLFSTCIKNDDWKVVKNNFNTLDIEIKSGVDLEKKLIPIGSVVVFTASNFPFAYSTIGGDVTAALAAGCPVIVKSHYMHAGTGDLVSQVVLQEAKKLGLPDGVFSNLNGFSNDFGKYLVQKEGVKMLTFTGSYKGGKAIQQYINDRQEWIPFFAEMGSVNPIFIADLEDNKEINLQKIASSIANNAGQFCTNPGLIFCLNTDIFKELSIKLTQLLSLEESKNMLHFQIREKFLQKVKILKNKKSSVTLLDENSENSIKLKPILLSMKVEDFLSDPSFHEEVFGSFTILVECNSINDFEKTAHHLKGQITCSIFLTQKQQEEFHDFIDNLAYRCGRIVKNDVPTGVTVHQAMHHGGPFPASSDSRFTAVGPDSIYRFLRPVCYQGFNK
ncbi:MAG: aldehyde dehydrogenase family protein [Flavobacteriia bacterium]|nr:aldehyde dehydrogenase family protein [Flavobacteriia bacterium]